MTAKSLLKKISSWDNFQESLSTLNKKEKGNAFELLTKLYFKIEPIYNFYNEIWLLDEVPQKDLDYLGLPSQDLGIDLIAKSGNEYHAIQCKYHSDRTSSVTFKEISTFVSLVESNPKFTKAYICSSADVTSKNFDKVKTDKIIKVMSDSWQKLDIEFFKEAYKLLEGKKVKLVPFKPFSHQKKALKEASTYFEKEGHSRGKLIFPCGAGKSLTGYWITKTLKSKSTIIAVPSLSLVKQTLEVYLRENVANNEQAKWLCICSDEGIGRNDDVAIYTEDIGVPCVTDPDYIEDWLIENKEEEIIIFTTYQSGRIIAEISEKLNFTFDVGIFDEAHKTVGSDKKLFSHLLFDENISIDKRIFMTATERFYAGSKDDIISMDDYDIYGDTFAQMSFKEAIELDLLTDYKVITIDVKKSEISDFIRQNNLIQLNDKWKKETEARSLASMLALRKAMKQFPIKNAVSFHSSIEKAVRNKELQEHITDTYDYQPIDTYTVSGKIPTTKRNNIVQEFARSDKALITNARCLTEGVDVPNIDCIVFADPRRSRVDIVQALGRALRKKDGKDWGYVILPVIYDEETQEIDNDNFNEILSVVRGLASNDERVVEYFKDKSSGEATGRTKNGDDIFSVISDYLDEEELTKELQIRLWDKLAKFNWLPFEEAREFVRGLGLKNQTEWEEYCMSGNKPKNISYHPERNYKDIGWVNYGDWLGTGAVATFEKKFKSFEDARNFVRKLKLKSQREWAEYCRSGNLPNDIPRSPARTYKYNGWNGDNDWFGYGKKQHFREFKDARDYVRKLGLTGQIEWREYIKSGNKPEDIPSAPAGTYKHKGWVSYGDWFGTGYVTPSKRKFISFNDATDFVWKLNLKSLREWREYCKSGKKPDYIPSTPSRYFKDNGWKGWGNWLGTQTVAPQNKVFLIFEDARKYVRGLNIKGNKEWREYCKSGEKPKNIPSAPERIYKHKGWKGFGDWLGTGKIWSGHIVYKDFEEARIFARKLGLNNLLGWQEYSKSEQRPNDIPSSPQNTYKNKGWKGWGDWLGTGNIANHKILFKNYNEARNYVKKLNFNYRKDWSAYCKSGKRPSDIPSSPQNTYKNKGWKGWADFFGKDK